MTALTRAVVSHDLSGMEAALRANPNAASEPEGGWLPLEWAKRSGNIVTLMRLARLIESDDLNYQFTLIAYVRRSGVNYFGGGSVLSTAEQLWEQSIEGKPPRPFTKDESDVALTPEAKLDVAYFIRRARISSVAELLRLANAA